MRIHIDTLFSGLIFEYRSFRPSCEFI